MRGGYALQEGISMVLANEKNDSTTNNSYNERIDTEYIFGRHINFCFQLPMHLPFHILGIFFFGW